jgi:hypothetical protein
VPPQNTEIPGFTARHPDEMLIGLDSTLDGVDGDLDDYDPIQRDEILAASGEGGRRHTFLLDRDG